MPRLSILGSMGVILAVAVASAALRDANAFWAGLCSLLTALALGYAVLAVIYLRGREQAWWLGFAVFLGEYLVLALGSWPGGLGDRRLATTQLLHYVHSQVAPPRDTELRLNSLQSFRSSLVQREAEIKRRTRLASDPALVSVQRKVASLDAQIKALQTPPLPPPSVIRWRSAFPGAANLEDFQRVGRCIFAVLTGQVGAFLACRVQARGSGSMIEHQRQA